MKNRLKNIANHLLDFGKRNRLLNYKDAGLRTLNILNRDISDIFNDIINSKVYSIFQIDPILEKYHEDLIVNPEDDNILEYSDLKVYDITNSLIKKNQLICYKRGYSLNKVLKNILKEYKYSINEKGINSLFITFGFITYLEEKNKYKAPLLLIPINIKEENGIYKIKEEDDEIILNPTLEYYFKLNFNVALPKFEGESYDEYILQILKLLPKNVEYISGISLGIYSFLKMNMYNDLIDNADMVIQNQNIQALLGEKNYIGASNVDLPHPVVNCDSSQLEAIKLACSGNSFVLQGPPGSGKSQTITNIISSLLANNRKILFVSEKLAALNVVYENLKRVGLDEFVIELHSSKANKKDFIEELYNTAEKPRYDIDVKEIEYREKHEILKSYLDSYCSLIHHKTQYNESIYDLYSDYMNINVDAISYKIKGIEKYSFKDLEQLIDYFNEYQVYIKNLGYDYRKLEFYGLRNLNRDYIRYELESDFSKAIKYISKLNEFKAKLDGKTTYDIKCIKDIYNMFDFISALIGLHDQRILYLDSKVKKELNEQIDVYFDTQDGLKQYDNTLSKYNKDITKEDLDLLIENYSKKKFINIFNFKYKKAKKIIFGYRKTNSKKKNILNELNELVRYKHDLRKIKIALITIKQEFKTKISIENLIDIKADLEALEKFDGIKINDNLDSLKNYLTDLLISFKTYLNEDINISKISNYFDSSIINLYTSGIEDVYNKLLGVYSKKASLEEYLFLEQCISNIKNKNQIEYLNYYLDKNYNIDDIAIQFKKLFYEGKLYELIDKSPILSDFNSNNHLVKVNEFKELDERMLMINKDKVIHINSKNRPDDVIVAGSKFNILRREYNKKRRQKPIRMLLSEIFDLVLDIKPVFLMSPLSVSTYLSNNLNMFDCVIFDEASQIFAWDALGAIYRSKQCIIIGDSKQMPPSNFFGANVEDNEDDYSDDLESILDIASTSFTSSSLKWHYRSRSEELIDFSNKKFYNSNLITIPQAKKHEPGFGIDFIYLPNGRYDLKTRTNRIEAEHICDMVVEHLKNSSQSLGVVAFSKVQADLIEDLIEKRIELDPSLSKYFDEDRDEPFFVKNLETVQGDERDRIIFSICYGYNENNKFYQRFGPLNNLGGERRLNVAITRAKYNISVVSSIKHSDIKSNNEGSLGSKLLKDYLEFCENVTFKKECRDTDDGVINDIKNYLEELGYSVLPNYGASSFKIDLAVKDKNTDEFILAIMLDKSDDKLGNTSDINRLQSILIERLGWRYHKIYSTAWFKQKSIEKKKLDDVLANQIKVEKKIVNTSLLKENSESGLLSKFINYDGISLEEIKSCIDNDELPAIINKIISLEQPISFNYICQRVAKAMGKAKATNVIKTMVNKAIPDTAYKLQDFYFIDYNIDKYKLRINSDRTIDDIYIEELKHGIYSIVLLNNGITVDGCYKTLTKILGFSRVTENTRKLLDNALVFLKLDGKITQRGDLLFS